MAENRKKGDKSSAGFEEKKKPLAEQERAKKEAFLIQNKKAIADKKKEEERSLIAKAAAENDLEFTKNENLYFDAVKSLGDLLDFIEKHNLKKIEKDKAKDIEDLTVLSGELEGLVNNKNYTKFAEDYAVFKNALKELDLQIKEELKTVKPEPEEKPAAEEVVETQIEEEKEIPAAEEVILLGEKDRKKPRSEERRVGKECTSWCRSRWSP